MFLTRKHLSRRTLLKGAGATIALPLLDAMVPSMTALANTAAAPVRRLGFIYMPMGCDLSRWTPVSTDGTLKLLSPTLKSLEPFRDYLTIVSNTDVRQAEPYSPKEIGGDHFRSSAAYLTQSHPKQTEGSDI